MQHKHAVSNMDMPMPMSTHTPMPTLHQSPSDADGDDGDGDEGLNFLSSSFDAQVGWWLSVLTLAVLLSTSLCMHFVFKFRLEHVLPHVTVT